MNEWTTKINEQTGEMAVKEINRQQETSNPD